MSNPYIFDVGDHLQLKVDYASDTITYYGYSSPNVTTDDDAWIIKRETKDSSGRTIALEFANGNNSPTNIWDNRASLNFGA